MRYLFKEFEFDCSNLVLKQNGKDVALRNNEASLLALLIKSSDKVLSKEDILSQVWEGKVVSEQAVFQNISHLRSILGGDAIKTFPKRGYQWQLSFKQASNATAEDLSPNSPSPESLNTTPSFSFRKIHWLFIVLVMAIIIGSIVIANISLEEKELERTSIQQAVEISYVPIYNAQTQKNIIFPDRLGIDFTALTDVDSTQFKNSIELKYPLLAKENPLILTGHIRTLTQEVFLNFSLKGPFDTWEGEVTAASIPDVIDQLHTHLSHTFIYDLLNRAQSPEVKQASLLIAHQQSPEDDIILGHLVEAFMHIGQLDKARVMAEKLASNAIQKNNVQQLGHAYLYQSYILLRQKQLPSSVEKVYLALEQFEKSEDLGRQADAWKFIAQLAHEKGDYLTIKSNLMQSAHLSQQADDIQREVDALAFLSILAHKFKKDDDKYFYLLEAKSRMKAHNLPLYHFAIIPFYEAAFVETPSAKEPYFLKVLTLTKASPNNRMAQTSRLQLMEHYLKTERFTAANKLVANLATDNARNSYLRTLLYKAENKSDEFIRYAKRTFEQAQLAGNKHLSLDAALLLLGSEAGADSYDFYHQYIQKNATPRWRIKRKEQLSILDL